LLAALGERLEEVGVEEVIEDVSEVVGLVESNLLVEVALVEVIDEEGLLMGEQLVDG
jgi:hypothetical protein